MEGRGERSMTEYADVKLREWFHAYDAFRTKYDEFARKADPYLSDPTISEGAKATVRTALNAALACGDLFPGAGLASTMSVTALKGVSKTDKFLKWMRVPLRKKKEGETSKLQVLDLTPDVGLRTSLGFQMMELCSFGFLPMRTIEGLMQANHDVPRIWRAYKNIRKIAEEKARISDEERNAIAIFEQGEEGTV